MRLDDLAMASLNRLVYSTAHHPCCHSNFKANLPGDLSQGLESCSDYLTDDFSNRGFNKTEVKFQIRSFLPEWECR